MAATANELRHRARTRIDTPDKVDDGLNQYVQPITDFADTSVSKTSGESIVFTGYKGVTGTSACSFAAWINCEGSTGVDTIAHWGSNGSNGQEFWLRLNGGKLAHWVGDNNNWAQSTSTALGDSDWHLVVVTYPSSATLNDVRLYVDGSAESISVNGTGSQSINVSTSTDVYYGQYQNPANNWGFDGTMTMFGIWDVQLSADAITSLYNGGKTFDWESNSGDYTSSGDLVKYCPFVKANGDGSGTTLNEVIDGSPDGSFANGLGSGDWLDYPN